MKEQKPIFYADNDQDEEIRISDYWHVIKRHKWGIIGLALVAGLIGAISAFSSRPVYVAEAKLLVEPEQPKVISLESLQASANIWFFYETQYEIIASRSVASAVINKLALDKNPVFTRENDTPSFFNVRRFLNWRKWIPEEWRRSAAGANKKRGVEDAREALINYFLGGLYAGGEEKSQIVSVTYEADDPELAADITNAVVDAYIEKELESRLAIARQATSWLTNRLDDLRHKLEGSETALVRFQSHEGVVDTKSQQDIIRGKLSSVTGELIKAQIKLAEAESRYNQVRKADRTGRKYDSLQPVLQNLLIQRLKEEESKLGRRVAELSDRYGEKHPKMIAARSDLKEASRRLKGEVAKVVDGIRKEYEVALENERKMKRLSQKQQSDVRKMKGKEFELAKLEREVEANRQLYEMFSTRFKETNLDENKKITNIRVIDRAKPPLRPSKPRKRRMIGVSALMGLILGVMLAFLLEHLDNTFKNHEDIERKLALPALGIMPEVTKKELRGMFAGRKIIHNPQSHFPEAVNNIRTSVLFANLDNPPKTIMVTSALPDEGKTSMSCALALSLSQLGPTLLLESDFRKPSISRVMGMSRKKSMKGKAGLTNAVLGNQTLEEVVKRDAIFTRRQLEGIVERDKTRNLFFTTSGPLPPNPVEFLSSGKFATTLSRLAGGFDNVVIDTPPVMPFSDALVIGRMVDAVILVVKADHTAQDVVLEALRRLRASHITPLGVVLSRVNTQGSNGYGGYYDTSYYMRREGKKKGRHA